MKVAGVSLEAMAANPKQADPKHVAREFEALLVAAVWKKAVSQPIGEGSRLSGGSAGRMYREMLIEEVAKRAAEDGRFGLGNEIASRMQKAADSEGGDDG